MNRIDIKVLSSYTESHQTEIRYHMGGVTMDTPDGQLTYINNGSDVLGVAHLDTVQAPAPTRRTRGKLHSPTLDNRLGAFLVCHYIPTHIGNIDILLTDNEERGRSTGQYFHPSKTYNWIFSFDRGGADNVLYQYDSIAMRAELENFGLDVGIGSYSDIVDMSHLGANGVNFGCGMQNYHFQDSYTRTSVLLSQLAKFRRFFVAHKNTAMEYVKRERPESIYGSMHYDYTDCDECNQEFTDDKNLGYIWDYGLCKSCAYNVHSEAYLEGYPSSMNCDHCGADYVDMENIHSLWDTDYCMECYDKNK